MSDRREEGRGRPVIAHSDASALPPGERAEYQVVPDDEVEVAEAVAGPEGDVELAFDGGTGADRDDDLSEADVVCVSCVVEAVRRLELPGGRTVRPASVPYTDEPAGVRYVRVCPECDEVIVRE